MQKAASSLSSWAKAIKRTLDAAGHDSLALFEAAGMDPRALDDPGARYPLEQTTRLWRLAVEATGDPCLGLRVASHISQTTFHALGYTLMASGTLREAFDRVVRNFRLVTDAVTLSFDQHGDAYHFVIHPPTSGMQPADEALDAFVSAYVRMCRAALGRDYSPMRIDLRRQAPADPACFHRILRAPIVFGAAETRLILDAESLQRPLDSANPELVRHNEAMILHYLSRYDREDILARLRAALIAQMEQGEPPQESIARSLCISARSLQRRLAGLGLTYKKVLDEARHELALSYLCDQRHSVTEVTYLLGFSDTSSFTRAFRRWTGMTPSRWREARPH